MKITISRLCTLFLLIAVSFGTFASAQHIRRGGGYHHRYSGGYGAHHAIHDVGMVADGAMTAIALGRSADYTGIRFGYNAATMRTPDLSGINHDVNSGINLGIVFGWYLGNTPLIFEPGFLYSKKGGTLKGTGVIELSDGSDRWEEASRNKTNISMHMLEIPLVLKYEVQYHNLGICLQPFVGGFLSFGAGGTIKYSEDQLAGSNFIDGEWDTFGSDSFCRTDAGLRYGCGLGMGCFYAELSWDLGLVNLDNDFGYQNYFVSSDRQSSRSYEDGVYSNNISLTIGVNF